MDERIQKIEEDFKIIGQKMEEAGQYYPSELMNPFEIAKDRANGKIKYPDKK